jgi:hypothetical protein
MARRAFFSFHFDRDCWRVGQVRNSWVVRGEREAQPFLDAGEWEKVKQQGDKAIKDWIDKNLNGKSVTVVLIGLETSQRPWVKYEIEQSHLDHKGLLGIYIHGVKDKDGRTDRRGPNPFDLLTFEERDSSRPTWGFPVQTRRRKYSDRYPVYDWVTQEGRNNINKWIEDAAKAAGR